MGPRMVLLLSSNSMLERVKRSVHRTHGRYPEARRCCLASLTPSRAYTGHIISCSLTLTLSVTHNLTSIIIVQCHPFTPSLTQRVPSANALQPCTRTHMTDDEQHGCHTHRLHGPIFSLVSPADKSQRLLSVPQV